MQTVCEYILKGSIKNVSHSVHLSSECWQNLKSVHNKIFSPWHSYLCTLLAFPEKEILPCSFSNSLIHSPPAQPFYIYYCSENNQAFLFLSFGRASRKVLLLFATSSARFSFPLSSPSYFSNLIHQLIENTVTHQQPSVAIIFNYFIFLQPAFNKYIDIRLRLDIRGIIYQCTYTFRTFNFLANYRVIFLLLMYFPRLANSWPVKPLLAVLPGEVILISLVCLGKISECM